MADRILPGAYVSLNDLSQLPEGATSLTVGYVLDAKRGPVNELTLVTSPTDFLTKFTFSGKPSLSDDKTFFSILKVLARTNKMYVCRAANNPLFGGAVVRKAQELGALISGTKVAGSTDAFLVVAGDLTSTLAAGDVIQVTGTTKKEGAIDGRYIVKNVTAFSGNTKVFLTGNLPNACTASASTKARVTAAPVVGLDSQKIATIKTASTEKQLIFDGDLTAKFALGNKIVVKNATATANNKTFTVEDNEEADPISYDLEENETTVKVKEDVVAGVDGDVYYESIGKVDNFAFTAADENVMLITGANPGAYNKDIAVSIVSSVDNEDMIYRKGNVVGGKEITFDTMTLTVINSNTGATLETFTFSRDPEAKTIDGATLFVDEIVKGSAYIKIVNNEFDETYDLPNSTVEGQPINLTGGDNGGAVDANTLVASIEQFKDKTVTISILGNGCSVPAETKLVQQALMEVADTRKDLVCFLNNRAEDENYSLNSDKAQHIVDYKKDLGNTSFYGCMYAPHVSTADTFNNRTVKIGAEAVAIAGWLDVIANLNYPYAYAGPRNGLVQGVTCDWKIGDMSGEAEILNNASVNYVAYDGKIGRYYMQCQNTLQVAASSMRNLGTVFNVLDIKEHFVDMLKEYIQMPITNDLRRDIIDVANDYINPMIGNRLYNATFQDVTTELELAQDELHFLITLAPTPYAQKIFLTMNIVNASFDFSIVQSL